MRTLLGFLVLFCVQATMAAGVQDSNIQEYKDRYALKDAFHKLIDNKGEGYAPLYGIRNFRTVLSGVMYRGGANNYYHKIDPRPNSNPLPEDGLENLCKQGFDLAVYLYSTNFESASKSKTCKTVTGQMNTLRYVQISAFEKGNPEIILKYIYDSLVNQYDGPIYTHCWNGWHASGLVSALALRQFCGVSSQKAVAYWDKATDGINTDSNYEKVRKLVRDFKPSADLMLTEDLQKKVCPSL